MKSSWGKWGQTIALSMVFCISMAHADDSNCKEKKSRFQKKKAEQKKACCEPEMPRNDGKNSNGVITPSANAFGGKPDFFIQGEALYFKATEDNLNTGIKSAGPISSNFINGSVVDGEYDWDWGVRGIAGFNTSHDNWDVLAKWMWFKTDHNQNYSSAATTTEFLQQVATFNSATGASSPQLLIPALNLSSKLHLIVNVGDLEIGRDSFISKRLKLRPHVGVRGLWLTQNLYMRTGYIVDTNSTAQVLGKNVNSQLAANTSLVKQKYRISCKGGGIYAGLNSEWDFARDWSLFGLFDQSLIYARNHTSFSESSVTPTIAEYTRSNVKNSTNVVRSITDLALGFRWSHTFCEERFKISLQAAWEEHLFYNFNEFNIYNRNGNLALSGGSFGARFDF